MYLIDNIKKHLHRWVSFIWYQPKVTGWLWLLWPLSILYKISIGLKNILNRRQPYQSVIPTIVVGNITVGGSGKTPAIIALIKFLEKSGKRVGVISRGYPINPINPIRVTQQNGATQVGDEALLIYLKTKVPVVVCRNRVKAIQYLTSKKLCDVILSDDGLQNPSFYHDIEIVMLDASYGFGNGHLLPMGPLREPLSRLESVDFIVAKRVSYPCKRTTVREKNKYPERSSATPNLDGCHPERSSATPNAVEGSSVLDPSTACRDQSRHSAQDDITEWIPACAGRTQPQLFYLNLSHQQPVNLTCWLQPDRNAIFKPAKLYAVTAIANPQSFFDLLKQMGLNFEAHAFPDHYVFEASDFTAMQDGQIIMTEKDAVKCLSFADSRYWCVPLMGQFSAEFETQLLSKVMLCRKTEKK